MIFFSDIKYLFNDKIIRYYNPPCWTVHLIAIFPSILITLHGLHFPANTTALPCISQQQQCSGSPCYRVTNKTGKVIPLCQTLPKLSAQRCSENTKMSVIHRIYEKSDKVETYKFGNRFSNFHKNIANLSP